MREWLSALQIAWKASWIAQLLIFFTITIASEYLTSLNYSQIGASSIWRFDGAACHQYPPQSNTWATAELFFRLTFRDKDTL